MESDYNRLSKIADTLRKDVFKMVHKAGDGHPGPALSIADIVATLYFKEMKLKPDKPDWVNRDRFILSKGHACPIVYAALARKGYFSYDLLSSLRSLDSILEGHPDMKKTPGIDMTSGSLGNGLSIGAGMAVSSRVKDCNYTVYVIIGDGESQEGIVWEAAMNAVHYQIDNLIVFLDQNGLQSGGEVSKISGLLPVVDKWDAFGWHTQKIDGHSIKEICEAIENAKKVNKKPSIIIAKTIKGKGVPFIENDNSWHKRTPTENELKKALEVLGGERDDSYYK